MTVKGIRYLTCPVDDVEEHLGVILQPHGKVVQLLGLPDQGAPHVDPLVDGDARLLLGLGLVWRMRKVESVSQSACAYCASAVAVNQTGGEILI